jgi:hypothetical protein
MSASISTYSYLTPSFISGQERDVRAAQQSLEEAKLWRDGAQEYEFAAAYGYTVQAEPEWFIAQIYPEGKPVGVPVSSNASEARELLKQAIKTRYSMERIVEQMSEELVSLYEEQERLIPAHILAQLWAEGKPVKIVIDSCEEADEYWFTDDADAV